MSYSAYSDRTGEYVGPVQAVPEKKPRRGPLFPGGWWMTGCDPVKNVLLVHLRGSDLPVFMALMATMSENNMIFRTQFEIASVALVSEGATSKAISKMERLGLLRRIGRGVMQLSPYIVWRGKNEQHHQNVVAWHGWLRSRREAMAQCLPNPGEPPSDADFAERLRSGPRSPKPSNA